MEFFLKNPLTVWLRWWLKVLLVKLKYAGKHIRIEYLVELNSVKFTEYNTIRKYARLRDTSLGRCTYVGRESQVYHAQIGAFTCIGPDVIIGPGEHPTKDFVSSHPMFYSTLAQSNPVIVDKNLFEEFATTYIGNDVWIGGRAILKTGVRIGNGAIIAAGAVVSKDVQPYSIVGGIPAKLIRYRFSPEQIAILEEEKWWQRDLEWLIEHKNEFVHIDSFIAGLKTHQPLPDGNA